MKIIALQTRQGIQYENSFGIVDKFDDVHMHYTVRLHTNSSFEIMSEDEEHYAEGSLGIENGELLDYDGVFCLPAEILYMLRREGIDVAEMQESLEITEEQLQEAQRNCTFYQVDYDNQKEG